MAVIFNFDASPADKTSAAFNDKHQKMIREDFKLAPDTAVSIGATATLIVAGKMTMKLPMGMVDVQNKDAAYQEALKQFHEFWGSTSSLPNAGMNNQLEVPVFDDGSDEAWVIGISNKMFPGAVSLGDATELHQLVFGTDKNSRYRVAFIGPDLKGAVRFKGSTVSMRFCTSKNLAPEGEVRALLERLGVVSAKTTHCSTHSKMSGPYEGNEGEYRALFGAYYAALRPYCLAGKFPSLKRLMENTC